MSKNFELLRAAGISLGTGETLEPAPRKAAPQPVPPVYRPEEKPLPWANVIVALRKHWRLSALFAAVVMLTVTVITFSMKAIYEPVARIEVDPPGEAFSLDGGGAAASDAEYAETQAQNLASDRLAIAVVRKLHLDQNPEMVPDASTRAQNRPDSSAAANALQLTPAESAALAAFRRRMKVHRDTSSRLITVSFASHDPQLAATVTNEIVNTFIEQTFQNQHDAIMQSTQWLSRQLDDIRGRMEDSNRVLADFQKTIGVAPLDADKSTFTEHMTELNQQLTQAQADRIQLQALLTSVRNGSPDALPDVRNNPVVQQLSEKLADTRSQLSQALVVYGKNHPTVRKLQSQADELQKQLAAQKLAILGSIRSSYAAAHAREQLMDSQIKGATSELNQMARYNELKREAQSNTELYNALYAKVKEAGISAASKSSNLRVVDQARVLDYPTRPNRMLNLAFGFLVALIGGVGIALLRGQIDTRIFTPDDVRSWIGSSNISILPLYFTGGNGRLHAGNNGQLKSGIDTTAEGRRLAPGVSFLLDHPHSPEAEASRSLYTSIMLSRPGDPPQVVLVVSSLPGEGKTTVALNLVMAMAQHGNTCIVDADLRRGRIAGAFGVNGKLGLSDVLQGNATLEQVMVSVPGVPNLTIIPAHAGSARAGQMACSESMRELIEQLRQRFRFVVIDSAPLLPFADARALSPAVDGLVFVGRSGITTRDIVRRSLQLLEEMHGAPVLEFVLNAADLNAPQYRYYRYGYDYYQPVSQ